MVEKSNTVGIPFGFPALGVSVKPEGKSLQGKKVCVKGNLNIFSFLICLDSILNSAAGLQQMLTLLTWYQAFSVSWAQQKRRRRRRTGTASGLGA